jgi:integrase
MLFVVGINVGLRAGDLLNLRIGDVLIGNKIANRVVINEEKTGKRRTFELNKSAKDAILLYVHTLKSVNMDDYLFKSRKGEGALTVESTHKIIKNALKNLNVEGNYGSHSLRKTFSYHIYINNIKTNPSIINTLQKMLNHSNANITLKYIGITKEVISDVYNSLNL